MSNAKKSPRLDVFKSYLVSGAQFSELYEFPRLKKVQFKPNKARDLALNKKTSSFHWNTNENRRAVIFEKNYC